MNQRSSLRTLVLLPLLLFSFSTRAQWTEETLLVAGLNALELPSSIASLDANGDGWTDVIVADQERGCILLLNIFVFQEKLTHLLTVEGFFWHHVLLTEFTVAWICVSVKGWHRCVLRPRPETSTTHFV